MHLKIWREVYETTDSCLRRRATQKTVNKRLDLVFGKRVLRFTTGYLFIKESVSVLNYIWLDY